MTFEIHMVGVMTFGIQMFGVMTFGIQMFGTMTGRINCLEWRHWNSNVCSDDGQNQTFGVNTFAI